MKTFYEILGVQRDASRHEIREAFLQAAQAYHPDLRSDEFESDRQFKQIRRVYEVLNDPNKRRLYDQNRSFSRLEVRLPGKTRHHWLLRQVMSTA